MRVLQVLAEDTIGGTELHVATIAELLQNRASCEVATLFKPGPIGARLVRAEVPFFSLGGRSLPTRTRRLAGLIRAHRYDVVEAYGIKASLVARVACRAVRPAPAFVCGVQGLHITEVIKADDVKGRVALVLERATTGLVDRYDANSLGAIELLAQAGISRERMQYIPNGVDTGAWHPGADALRDREAVVVCAARLVERKRQEDLLDAVAALRRDGLPVTLRLLGDGPRRRALEDQADRLGLGAAVAFTGAVDVHEVRRHLSEAVVFALPSMWEGMPAAVLEAMASGLAIVASDVNGISDVIEDSVTGWLHQPGDVKTLTELLRTPLVERATAERVGEAARRYVHEHHSLIPMLDAKLQLYRELIER